VLFAEGEIVDGKGEGDYQIASEDFVKTIRSIRNNDKVKAVVMRVNSPGGSALASEVILHELQLLRQKKPLIVSMGDLAASGGYYISCQADHLCHADYDHGEHRCVCHAVQHRRADEEQAGRYVR